MAILWVREQQGRAGTENDEYRRTYTRVFLVKTDNINTGPQGVRTAVDPNTSGATQVAIPQIWDGYRGFQEPGVLINGQTVTGENDPAALCQMVRVRETDDPTIWEVEADYDTEIKEKAEQAENPLDEPAEITWDTEEYQEAIVEDLAGTICANSAGDQFTPPQEVEQGRSVLTIARNEQWYDESTARLYRNRVNSQPFMGYLPGFVKLKRMSAQRGFRNGVVFWRITYVFAFKDPSGNDWQLRPLDAGFRERTAKNPDVYRNITVGGQAVSQPVPLDGTGLKLISPALPVYLDFLAYGIADFNQLGLPIASNPGPAPGA